MLHRKCGYTQQVQLIHQSTGHANTVVNYFDGMNVFNEKKNSETYFVSLKDLHVSLLFRDIQDIIGSVGIISCIKSSICGVEIADLNLALSNQIHLISWL